MEYFDEELLEAKRALERQRYTTLETGMYAGEELMEFAKIRMPDNVGSIWLPKSFVPMPSGVKRVKYPSANAPEFLVSSVDTLVNFGFNFLPMVLKDDDIKDLRQQFQTVITSVNPAIKIQNYKDEKTNQGNDMSWFDFCGYHVDGQSYNRVCLIRMRKQVFHGIFNCEMKDKHNWNEIVGMIFESVEEAV